MVRAALAWARGVWREIVAAWRVGSVRQGFYGTVLITAGALSPAYLPRTSPWWQIAQSFGATGPGARIIGTIFTMGGLFLLVDGWFRLRPRHRSGGAHAYTHLRHWAILAIWGAPFLLAPPIFSHDAYSYAAQGWLVHNGINPYEAGPAILPGAFADQVSWVWRDTPAPYGPVSLQLAHLVVDVMGFRPYVSAVAMRVLAVIGVGVIGLLIPRLARQRHADPATAAWFATLNPVLVIDFIGGAHNDCLMMAFVVAALWVSGLSTPARWLGKLRIPGRPWWLLAAILIGLGAAIKQPAIMAAYVLPLLVHPWESWQPRELLKVVGRVLLSFAVAIASFCLCSVATGLGFGWINAVNVPGMVITIAPFTVIGEAIQLILNAFHLDPSGWAAVRTARTVGVIIAGLIIAWLAVTVARRRPIRFLSLAYLTAALALPAVRSWYILWGGLLLPVAKSSRRTITLAIWVTVILLCYNGINMAWRNNAMALGFALAVLIWLVTRTHQLSTRAKSSSHAKERS